MFKISQEKKRRGKIGKAALILVLHLDNYKNLFIVTYHFFSKRNTQELLKYYNSCYRKGSLNDLIYKKLNKNIVSCATKCLIPTGKIVQTQVTRYSSWNDGAPHMPSSTRFCVTQYTVLRTQLRRARL